MLTYIPGFCRAVFAIVLSASGLEIGPSFLRNSRDNYVIEANIKRVPRKSNWNWRIKTLRMLWAPFRILFLKGTTRYLSPIRVLVLRAFGARIESPVLICDGVRIWYPWNLSMGSHSAIGRDAEIYNFAPVSIGRNATVSQYTFICTASHDHRDLAMPLTYAPIEVGEHAWVAARAYVGPGVRVGIGSVVGACSVVVKNVDDWTVVAGNPARYVNARRLGDSERKIGEA